MPVDRPLGPRPRMPGALMAARTNGVDVLATAMPTPEGGPPKDLTANINECVFRCFVASEG